MAQACDASPLQRAKAYSHIKYGLGILDIAYLIVLLFVFLGTGLSKSLESYLLKLTANNFLLLPLYLAVMFVIYYLFSFPITFYRSYILERKFCLSTQSVRDWFLDQAKSGVISYLIGLILLSVFYYILRHNQDWWLLISFFWIFFNLILARLAPVAIIPLFFKYKALTDESLKTRIINLAGKMGVKILDVFEIDFSKKTLKANAAFLGWGSSRRVVLGDTLKDKYTYDEIEVILAHEFAHYKLKHLFKLITVNAVFIVVSFYLIFKTSGFALRLFGLSALSEIACLPLILIYFVLFGISMQPFEAYLSRRLERNADSMALTVTGLKDAFISMMEKLASQNLSDRNPHPIIKFFFFDHPPIDERINMAKQFFPTPLENKN